MVEHIRIVVDAMPMVDPIPIVDPIPMVVPIPIVDPIPMVDLSTHERHPHRVIVPVYRGNFLLFLQFFLCFAHFQTNGTLNYSASVSPEVVGIFDELLLDPVSKRQIVLGVEFPAEHSTACIAQVECHKCDRNDVEECKYFFGNRTEELANVSIKFS